MSTPFKYEMVYDAPIEAVAAMLSDPAFREEVCRAQRATSHDVTIDGDTTAKRVRIEMVQPTDKVPAFAAKIVGAHTEIHQVEDWSSPVAGDVSVTIPGKPGHMVGTAVLVERDGKTVETVEMDIKVKLPVVGGKIEGVLAKVLGSALKAEAQVGRDYLSR
ncbi:MAG TPA: DUF2505 domain-containing protein [Nocardioides sp.]|nr:DUF2505 domain-containing protein [Nocardioides sp.]